MLKSACSDCEQNSETLSALAEAWRHEDETEARRLFSQALVADGSEPVTLARYIEFEVAHLSNDSPLRLLAASMRQGIDRCHRRIEARVNLPATWSSLAVLQLLHGEPFESLSSLAQLIRLCEPSLDGRNARRPSAPVRALLRLLDTLRRLECIREKVTGYDWFHRMLLVGLAIRAHDPKARKAIGQLASWREDHRVPHFTGAEEVVIFSGGCALEFHTRTKAIRPLLTRACKGLSFRLISGGTRSGMTDIAGEVAARSGGQIQAVGYAPASLPDYARRDTDRTRYAWQVRVPGHDFTPLDPLQGWTDLAAAGVAARQVKLVSYGGGRISRVEMELALALGCWVGVIDDAALPRERRGVGPPWQDHPGLLLLPKDAMTLRAFLVLPGSPKVEPVFEKAARRVHENYLRFARPQDESMQPWDELRAELKLSCYHQVSHAVNMLKSVGLGVRRIRDRGAPVFNLSRAIGEKGIRRLAEMEHGRWNVERFLHGWRYAERKDVARKRSPFLVPWDQLPRAPQDIQQLDLEAVRNLPETFRSVGLEIYQFPEKPKPNRKP